MIETCCLWLTVATLMWSDPMIENNPLARPIVESKQKVGEITLGVMGLGALYVLERYKIEYPRAAIAVQVAWALGHTYAVFKNEEKGFRIKMVILPSFSVRF